MITVANNNKYMYLENTRLTCLAYASAYTVFKKFGSGYIYARCTTI